MFQIGILPRCQKLMDNLNPENEKDRMLVQLLEEAVHKAVTYDPSVTLNEKDLNNQHQNDLYGIDTEQQTENGNKEFVHQQNLQEMEQLNNLRQFFTDIEPKNRLVSTKGIDGELE